MHGHKPTTNASACLNVSLFTLNVVISDFPHQAVMTVRGLVEKSIPTVGNLVSLLLLQYITKYDDARCSLVLVRWSLAASIT